MSLPQFSVPEPPDGFLKKMILDASLRFRGMPADRAEKLAELIARKRWLMPEDIASTYLSRFRRNLEGHSVRP